jgi:hypothetical protein
MMSTCTTYTLYHGIQQATPFVTPFRMFTALTIVEKLQWRIVGSGRCRDGRP